MQEELEKANEQNKFYRTAKDKFLEKQKDLIEEHNTLLVEEEKLIKSRLEIEDHIQHYKDKIEEIEKTNAMKNNTKTRLNKDELSHKCKKAIENFLIIKEKDNVSNMRFKIELNGSDIIREIEDDNMTFKRLKSFFKQQFNKSEKDFYFADKDDRIYLDEMNIRKTLFPFNSVLIKGDIPVIKVVDKVKKIKNVEPNKEIEQNYLIKEIFTYISGGKTENLKKYFQRTKSNYISAVLFIIFLSLFIESCRIFRMIEYHNTLINPIKKSKEFNFDIDVNLNMIKCYVII
jgi:hypothetical protein